MVPKKYKDLYKKTDDLLDKDFCSDGTLFEYKNEQSIGQNPNKGELDFKVRNDPLSATSSAEAKYKYGWGGDKNNDFEGEALVKTDGSRSVKLTAKKLVKDTKVKLGHIYNPWLDLFDISTEVDYGVDKFHTTIAAYYGKKNGVQLTATLAPCECFVAGINGYFDLKKNVLKTYNAVAQFNYFKSTQIALEHESLPGANLSFGNWIVRLRVAEEAYKLGLKAALNKDTKTNFIELGAKHKLPGKQTFRWKLNNLGILTLGVKLRLWQQFSDALILRLGMELNASKRNIFEEEGNWGIGIKYKHETNHS